MTTEKMYGKRPPKGAAAWNLRSAKTCKTKNEPVVGRNNFRRAMTLYRS